MAAFVRSRRILGGLCAVMVATGLMAWRSEPRRVAATVGLLALVNFPELPKSPPAPEAVPVSLYVWNATDQRVEVAVAVAGTPVFQGVLQAGQGLSRHDVVTLLPGPYPVEAVAAGLRRTATMMVDPRGNRWLVVAWWGDGLEISVQRQPPWLSEPAR